MRKLPYVVTFSDGTKWNGRAHHVFVARVSGNQVRGLHYMDIAIKVEDQTYEFRGDIFKSGLKTRTIVRPSKPKRHKRHRKTTNYLDLESSDCSESSNSSNSSDSSQSSETLDNSECSDNYEWSDSCSCKCCWYYCESWYCCESWNS